MTTFNELLESLRNKNAIALTVEEIDILIVELGKEKDRKEIERISKESTEKAAKLNCKLDILYDKILELQKEFDTVKQERDNIYEVLDMLDTLKARNLI